MNYNVMQIKVLTTVVRPRFRGVQKNKNFKTALAQKLIPFLYSIESTVYNISALGCQEVLPLD